MPWEYLDRTANTGRCAGRTAQQELDDAEREAHLRFGILRQGAEWESWTHKERVAAVNKMLVSLLVKGRNWYQESKPAKLERLLEDPFVDF